MISLYSLKYWYTRRLGFLVEGSVRRGISPDTWTAVGVIAAAAGCGALVMGWWPAAFVLLAARLGGANLDGAVARARGLSRPFGFVLNEVGDRVSDLLVMGGLVGLALRTGASLGPVVLTLVAALRPLCRLSPPWRQPGRALPGSTAAPSVRPSAAWPRWSRRRCLNTWRSSRE